MPDYRRYYIPHGIVFITTVTKNREPILKLDDDIATFMDTLSRVQKIHPFNLLAYVILPDHFHCLMNPGNSLGDFSIILRSIKWNYTRNYKIAHNISTSFNLWQRGFWDHIIRNEQDLKHHIDYIHWNPVKHGLVTSPQAWIHSTYHFWYDRGNDPANSEWSEPPSEILKMDYE
jgi:putative transposase